MNILFQKPLSKKWGDKIASIMRKKDTEIIPEKMQLQSIKVFKSNLETTSEFLNQPQKVGGYNFGFNFEMAHNIEDGRIRFRLFFKLEAQDKKGTKLGLTSEYGIELYFTVENLKDYFQKTKGGIQMDAGLGTTLLGIAYSTSRGIILERMQGTFFEGVILPVINPFKELMGPTENSN